MRFTREATPAAANTKEMNASKSRIRLRLMEEFIQFWVSDVWHVPDRNGTHAFCDSLLELQDLRAVRHSEHFPEPACLSCLAHGHMISGFPTRKETSVDSY